MSALIKEERVFVCVIISAERLTCASYQEDLMYIEYWENKGILIIIRCVSGKHVGLDLCIKQATDSQ